MEIGSNLGRDNFLITFLLFLLPLPQAFAIVSQKPLALGHFLIDHSQVKSDPVAGPVWPRVWVEVYLYSSMTAALEGGECSAARPGRTLPPGKTRYPFYKRLGGPQGRSGRAENLIPTGNRCRIIQPVVSRYTD